MLPLSLINDIDMNILEPWPCRDRRIDIWGDGQTDRNSVGPQYSHTSQHEGPLLLPIEELLVQTKGTFSAAAPMQRNQPVCCQGVEGGGWCGHKEPWANSLLHPTPACQTFESLVPWSWDGWEDVLFFPLPELGTTFYLAWHKRMFHSTVSLYVQGW